MRILFTLIVLIATLQSHLFGQATLPIDTEFLDRSALPTGFSQVGLGSNYSGPKLKFDSAGDMLDINFNADPETLTFQLGTNNSFTGTLPAGTELTVTESIDGVTFTSVAVYGPGSPKGLQTASLTSTSRFVKMEMTMKASGTNIAVFDIDITASNPSTDPVIEFSSDTYSLQEDGIVTTVCAEITNPGTTATTVEVQLDGSSTATNGIDYDDGQNPPMAITFPTTLTFPANASGGDLQQCFDIFISMDDTEIEGDETIILNLGNPSGTATIGSIDQATVTIFDNDFAPTFAILINEILADPGSGEDPNQDGSPSTTNDEFIEFYNDEGVPLDISGFTISDNSQVRFTFPAGAVIPTDAYFTVFGGGNSDNIPGITFVASSLGLNNSGDDITLRDLNGNTVVEESFGSEGGNNNSLARNPNLTGDFEEQNTFNSGVNFTPNRTNDTPIASNNLCADAKVLAMDQPNLLTSETFGYALNETDCSGDNPGVWYNVNTDDNGGQLTITVTPSGNLDVSVSVFDACGNAALDCVDANGPGTAETITITDPSITMNKGGTTTRSDVDYKILVADVSTPTLPTTTFAIEAAGSALPVELLSFDAKVGRENVQLHWITSSERNNEGFEVQKSADSREFEAIGFMKGQGTSTNENVYSFTDDIIEHGKTYYRLKQMDFDGNYVYSDAISVVVIENKFTITPTSTTDMVNVTLEEDMDADISVFSANGQLVFSQSSVSDNTAINLVDYNAGTYIIVVTTERERFVQKVMKF